MVELIPKQSALDAIDKESKFIEREINDATKHPDEYTDNFISFSRERQCGLADAYIAVDELSPVETMTDDDIISRQAAINAVHKYFVGLFNDEPYETDEDGDEVFTDMKSVNALLKYNKEVSKAIKALPSADREDYEKGYKDGQLAVMTGNDEKEFERGYRMGQAADRPKGEWIEVTNGRGGHECSECHSYAPSYASGDEHLSDYCPNCGAKMDKGED